LGNFVNIKFQLPDKHPSKSMLGSRNQLKFHKSMNSLRGLNSSINFGKLSGSGFRGSMTLNMVIRLFRQVSTIPPACSTRSCSWTTTRRRRGFDRKKFSQELPLGLQPAIFQTWHQDKRLQQKNNFSISTYDSKIRRLHDTYIMHLVACLLE
jgi:hypothetical protein